jgi:Cupin-like domain
MKVDRRDLFLSGEERYDVYRVKSSERPHLLETYDGDNRDESEELPLMDGCDIPQWRAEKFVPSWPHWEAAMNVGLGCPLLRRESQLPIPPYVRVGFVATSSSWENLKDFLLRQPTSAVVERISCSQASQFLPENDLITNPKRRKIFSKWEEQNIPVIVEGATEGWNLEAWNFEKIVERFGDVRWRFSDTHGAMMTLSVYDKYISTEGLSDDSPLAVYDSEFGDDNSPMQELLPCYQAPPCFSDDLFALALQNDNQRGQVTDGMNTAPETLSSSPSITSLSVTEKDDSKSRPPWRWILAGPARSGTGLHIDPLWTNAWVTLLQGTKRWILVPPDVQLPDGAGLREPQVPSVIWFRNNYEKVASLEGVIEILQKPGETVCTSRAVGRMIQVTP